MLTSVKVVQPAQVHHTQFMVGRTLSGRVRPDGSCAESDAVLAFMAVEGFFPDEVAEELVA